MTMKDSLSNNDNNKENNLGESPEKNTKSKNEGNFNNIIISEPEIISFKINQDSDFIVLGSKKIYFLKKFFIYL